MPSISASRNPCTLLLSPQNLFMTDNLAICCLCTTKEPLGSNQEEASLIRKRFLGPPTCCLPRDFGDVRCPQTTGHLRFNLTSVWHTSKMDNSKAWNLCSWDSSYGSQPFREDED